MFTYLVWNTEEFGYCAAKTEIILEIMVNLFFMFFTIPLDIICFPIEILALIIYKVFYKRK